MFNSNKKLIFVDYQDSYFYQQKRKKQRRKWFKYLLLFAFLATLIVAIVPLTRANTFDAELNSQSTSSSESSLIQGPDNSKHIALPLDITLNIEVNGLVAYAQIKQVFINPYNIELEGKYQFPLPESAAIKHLKVKVADKEIIGQIMEKKAAKAVYERAKKRGKKASLVQQQRPNLFTNNIANIPAQSTVVVTLDFIMPVTFNLNQLSLKLPFAMTARYQSENYQKSPAQQHTEFIPSQAKVLANSKASINIVLNAGASVATITSNSHINRHLILSMTTAIT